MQQQSSGTERLLFITSNRLGDAVLSTGLLAIALERFLPRLVTVVCGPVPAPLFTAVPHLENVIILSKQKNDLHWLALWWKLGTRRWDVIVDVRSGLFSHFLRYGRRYRRGMSDPQKHKTEQLADVLGLPTPPFNTIWLTDAVRRYAELTLPAGEPILALCPTAQWPAKQWPPDRFFEAARKLPFRRVAVFGLEQERSQVAGLVTDLQQTCQVFDLIGQTDALQAAACLSRCRLCLANDSGLMHLAAAVDTPTVGIFGPSNEVQYRPWGRYADFVRAAPFEVKSRHQPEELMLQVTAGSVVAAAHKVLSQC